VTARAMQHALLMPRIPNPRQAAARGLTLTAVEANARKCRRCPLWKRATQTVFGSGPRDAVIMFVGEQPGDVEDVEGEPFVGPAGRLLRASLADAGIDEGSIYLTNAVKHFKWRPSGKRRIHERPNYEEVLACHLWLESEISIVKPRVLVALGATAASAILPQAKVMRDRAKPFTSPLAEIVTLTVHPSSILRAGGSQSRATARRQFVRDLQAIARMAR
jgi:uracil-DNA glycosylase family protein